MQQSNFFYFLEKAFELSEESLKILLQMQHQLLYMLKKTKEMHSTQSEIIPMF